MDNEIKRLLTLLARFSYISALSFGSQAIKHISRNLSTTSHFSFKFSVFFSILRKSSSISSYSTFLAFISSSFLVVRSPSSLTLCTTLFNLPISMVNFLFAMLGSVPWATAFLVPSTISSSCLYAFGKMYWPFYNDNVVEQWNIDSFHVLLCEDVEFGYF